MSHKPNSTDDLAPQLNSSAEALASHESKSTRLRHDFLSSIVVFLVALPLCMGVAIASGAPVAAGLITGIIGGLVVGSISGAPMQVSGPAAGLTVIVYGIIQSLGLETLGIVVLLAGFLQLIAGIFRLGQWFRAVSPAVIEGMLAGIGVLIFSSQFHVMVDDKPKENGVQNIITIPDAIKKGLPLPEWKSAEENQFHTDKLKQIGMLHERQVQIRERVAELVPAHYESEQEELVAVFPPDLVSQQSAVLAELQTAVKEIEAQGLTSNENDRERKLSEATDKSVEHSRIALAHLEAGAVKEVRQSQQFADETLRGVLDRLKNHDWAAKLGVLTIILIIVWQAFVPKKLRLVPAPLIAIVAVTAFTYSLSLPVLYVEVPDNLFNEIHLPTMTTLGELPIVEVVKMAFVVAIVASAETLLCATAVDQMHQGPRTKYDKELAAQGVGNMLCGLVGALPMTGVIVRSAANVQAGARSRLSAILHGAWILGFVVGASFLLRAIPTAGLAAILVFTGYKLMHPQTIRELWKYGIGEVAIYLITVITIVTTDLLTGVLVGMAASGAKLLYTFSDLQIDLKVRSEARMADLALKGAATFIGLPKLASRLEEVPPNVELHVDLNKLDYIDHACLDLLMNWAKQHEATGGSLVIDWESLHANFRRELESSMNEAHPHHTTGANGSPAKQTAKSGN
ncbi:MAG: SulP family inorganic anion transporter [Planctomycetaceae bacterium]